MEERGKVLLRMHSKVGIFKLSSEIAYQIVDNFLFLILGFAFPSLNAKRKRAIMNMLD